MQCFLGRSISLSSVPYSKSTRFDSDDVEELIFLLSEAHVTIYCRFCLLPALIAASGLILPAVQSPEDAGLQGLSPERHDWHGSHHEGNGNYSRAHGLNRAALELPARYFSFPKRLTSGTCII
ncbi:hypothetical protein Zmor_003999 [Zophobas morio]|uniref:Uncharacterized protein n=1 Tax=Zophobas morio TaxID=2755281 RepID=A0AA38HIS0_9CUCU|nr:hypothetical protein Zmor_003999 [Zophobas morio]